MNSLQPNTLELRDQYGNVDTNNDGVINEKDDGYQTDVLYNPMGLGADKLNNVTNWVQSAYDENGNLKTGDWAGDVGDQTNAMDLLLSSEKFNNGRVPDVSMVENIVKTREGDVLIRNDNRETGVKGIVEETVLSDTFFSEMNTKVIQDTIRYHVYKKTNFVVEYQSPQELFIIMRSILLQHANFKIGQTELIQEVQKLNKLVGQLAPTYVGDSFMRGNFAAVTIGDYLLNQTGFFNSINLSWNTDYQFGGQDGDSQLPHVLDVQCSFQPVHNFNTTFGQQYINKVGNILI